MAEKDFIIFVIKMEDINTFITTHYLSFFQIITKLKFKKFLLKIDLIKKNNNKKKFNETIGIVFIQKISKTIKILLFKLVIYIFL